MKVFYLWILCLGIISNISITAGAERAGGAYHAHAMNDRDATPVVAVGVLPDSPPAVARMEGSCFWTNNIPAWFTLIFSATDVVCSIISATPNTADEFRYASAGASAAAALCRAGVSHSYLERYLLSIDAEQRNDRGIVNFSRVQKYFTALGSKSAFFALGGINIGLALWEAYTHDPSIRTGLEIASAGVSGAMFFGALIAIIQFCCSDWVQNSWNRTVPGIMQGEVVPNVPVN